MVDTVRFFEKKNFLLSCFPWISYQGSAGFGQVTPTVSRPFTEPLRCLTGTSVTSGSQDRFLPTFLTAGPQQTVQRSSGPGAETGGTGPFADGGAEIPHWKFSWNTAGCIFQWWLEGIDNIIIPYYTILYSMNLPWYPQFFSGRSVILLVKAYATASSFSFKA